MSPQPSRSPDRFSLAALAEDHPTAPAQGDESESLPCVNAQRGEPNPVSYTHLTLPTNREA